MAVETRGKTLLVDRMAARRLRQQDVARLCGVSQAAVSYWRSGVSRPRAEARYALEAELGIDAEAWLTVDELATVLQARAKKGR